VVKKVADLEYAFANREGDVGQIRLSDRCRNQRIDDVTHQRRDVDGVSRRPERTAFLGGRAGRVGAEAFLAERQSTAIDGGGQRPPHHGKLPTKVRIDK